MPILKCLARPKISTSGLTLEEELSVAYATENASREDAQAVNQIACGKSGALEGPISSANAVVIRLPPKLCYPK